MSNHHDKCCLSIMAKMTEPQFLRMLAEVQVELGRRFPDLQGHVDKLGITTENIGTLGHAIIDTVMTQCKGATKQ